MQTLFMSSVTFGHVPQLVLLLSTSASRFFTLGVTYLHLGELARLRQAAEEAWGCSGMLWASAVCFHGVGPVALVILCWSCSQWAFWQSSKMEGRFLTALST